nr:hypothetical protein [Tanacetum cinerariifolium]
MVITHCLLLLKCHLLELHLMHLLLLKIPNFRLLKTRKIDRLSRSLLIQGLPNDIYSLIDSNDTAKDLWDALERQMRGSENGEQDRKGAILYVYETFKAIEGEQLLDTYLCYLQVINDLKKCGYKKDNYELNYRFLNNLQPEWKLYIVFMVTSDPLVLAADKTKVSKRKEKVVVQLKSEGSDGEDISDLQKITALLAKDFNRKRYYAKPTNNNLRTFSDSSLENKKPEYMKSVKKTEDKKVDEKKRDMSKVKTKMLLAKKDSDEQVLLAEDQAWMESSSDSDQEISANMVFMAKMEKVLLDSEEISASAEETIAEVSYYTSDSESESEYETLGYDDNSITYGLFVDNDDDKEIFHDAIEFASENFNENYIVSQTDHDQSEQCIKKANQQSKDLENQNKDLQDKYDILKNQVNTFEEKNNEFNEQIKVLNETNVDLLAQMEVLQEQLKVKHVMIDTHNECQAQYAKLEEERYQYMIRYYALYDNDKQHRKKIDKHEILFDKTSHTLSSARRPKNNGVIWKKKGSSNTSNVDLSSISHSKLNKDVKRYSRKDLLSCNNSHHVDTRSDYACNDAMNVSCNSRLYASCDVNDLFVFDDVSIRKSQVSKMPFRKKPRDSLNVHSKSNLNNSLPRTLFRTVCFGNNDFAVIVGYEDVVIGSMMIKKVYYVKGLGHNLFSVGQFCHKGLEVAFRKSTCFVRNEDGVDLLIGDHLLNLYTIALNDIALNILARILAKASSSQPWLWHQYHLCFACEHGKIHRKRHKSKMAFASNKPLYLLHMNLCGSMRVESINGKRYVLVVFDDYSWYTWVFFLYSKDEASEVIISFIKKPHVNLQLQVQLVRTDNDTEFKKKTLAKFFDEVGTSQQFSSTRTPQRNGVVKRRNRTLVEAARTMLTFAHLPLFLWAEATATACFT